MDYADKIKGKGLVLVTGKKGSGKSHFVTKAINDIRKKYPHHQIYSDITGLNIDGVLPSPEDWQTAPNNCTIIYDEAQLLPWADNSSTKISSDSRVANMTLIRKQNKNIVLITQDPTFIHSALRKLVDYHYHISHPFKDGKPKVFYFAGAMSVIDDKGAFKTHALEEFTHPLDADTSKLYQSIEPDATHDQVRKYPKKVLYMIAFIIFLVLVGIPAGIWGVSKVYRFINSADENTQKVAQSVSGEDVNLGAAANTLKNGVSVNEKNNEVLDERRIYLRQNNLPQDYEIRRTDPYLQVRGVIHFKDKCTAVNAIGDTMTLSYDECLSYVNTGRVYKSDYSTTGNYEQTHIPDTTTYPTDNNTITDTPAPKIETTNNPM